MKKISKTIIFFGSGPVAAKSLKFIAKHFDVEAIITKPTTADEMHAAAPDVSLLTVENKVALTTLMATKLFSSQLGIIVDFGIIVEQTVIDYFPRGIINAHFSLLPEWRGADPITFTLLSGQSKTGVSLILIVEKLDEGPLLAQSDLVLSEDVSADELTDELIELSNHMIEEIVPLYMEGKLRPYEQPSDIKPTYSRKLTKEDGNIDWQKPAEVIEREIRAFAIWPKSRTTLAGKEVIITKARVLPREDGKVGEVFTADKQLVVRCGKDALVIERLKPAGKKEMPAQAFIAGIRR